MTKQASLLDPADDLTQILGTDLAKAFTAHRRAIKKPMTPEASRLMAKRLREMPDPTASAEQSIRCGWADCFPVKAEPLQKTQQFAAQPLRGMDALEQDLRERIDGHRNDRTGKRVDSAEAVPALSLLGWEGHPRPH